MRNQVVGQQSETAASEDLAFQQSFFVANTASDGHSEDWMTIGPVACEPEVRFHYNATENSIIGLLAKLHPFPPMRKVWSSMQSRAAWRVLDIGSATGHWIDFYRDVYRAAHITGVELTPRMATYLRQKYNGTVDIIEADIADQPPAIEPVEIISAIGVMFHITDDDRWQKAIRNLASVLKPGGLMLVGGEFGTETKDVQFHKTDQFASWTEHDTTAGPPKLVNKRVRSLEAWSSAASTHGLTIVDLVRTAIPAEVRTPENNLLVLRRTEEE